MVASTKSDPIQNAMASPASTAIERKFPETEPNKERNGIFLSRSPNHIHAIMQSSVPAVNA